MPLRDGKTDAIGTARGGDATGSRVGIARAGAPVREIHHPVELSELLQLPGCVANLRRHWKPAVGSPLHPIRQHGKRQCESQLPPHDLVVTAAKKDRTFCIENSQFVTVSIQSQPPLTQRTPQLDGEGASRLPPAKARGQASFPFRNGELTRCLEPADRRRDRLRRASDQKTAQQQDEKPMEAQAAG